MLQRPGAEEKAMSPDAKLQRDVLAELNWDLRLSAGHMTRIFTLAERS